MKQKTKFIWESTTDAIVPSESFFPSTRCPPLLFYSLNDTFASVQQLNASLLLVLPRVTMSGSTISLYALL